MHRITLSGSISSSLDHPIGLIILRCIKSPQTEKHWIITHFTFSNFHCPEPVLPLLSISSNHFWNIIILLSLNGFSPFFRRPLHYASYFIRHYFAVPLTLPTRGFKTPKIVQKLLRQLFYHFIPLFCSSCFLCFFSFLCYHTSHPSAIHLIHPRVSPTAHTPTHGSHTIAHNAHTDLKREAERE